MLHSKKSLGQHFLKDEAVAKQIVSFFQESHPYDTVLEIGAGKGALTKFLVAENLPDFFVVELDHRVIPMLIERFPFLVNRIFNEDFLSFNLNKLSGEQVSIIGNFPYNISSQIVFRILENLERVPLMVGMFQKEVAKRIVSPAGNKEYGILSVLVQTFYCVEYLLDVSKESFTPSPKVQSGVIRLRRKVELPYLADVNQYFRLVKSGFGQRRKTLRNSLKDWSLPSEIVADELLSKRAEQLPVEEWISLSNQIAA
jgi:16S rRNA (adenine1518-N6/adenine1519-N6)-dimethyltransferase